MSTNDFSYREEKIKKIWEVVLGVEIFDHNINFFSIGGDSFLLLKLHDLFCEEISESVQLIDLFTYTTINSQYKFFEKMTYFEKENEH